MRIHSRANLLYAFGIAFAALAVCLALYGKILDIPSPVQMVGYEQRLFDTSKVHDIQIVVDDWEKFKAESDKEQYVTCSIIIDNEVWNDVAIRPKGATSLMTVRSMDLQRYSLKIEFDRYQSGRTYYGLDKLCLNNSFQDNTYMKDYLAYQMMKEFGVEAPLCSYATVTVNAKPYGLFVAVEGVEDGFLQRNYGLNAGTLYKPDSFNADNEAKAFLPPPLDDGAFPLPGDFQSGAFPIPSEMGDLPDGMKLPEAPGNSPPDVKLRYTDDNPESYRNIFQNAKVHISEADQTRLIRSIQKLNLKNDLEHTLNMDEVLRFFVVHNYTVNGDSYTGSMTHNYYLHERDGELSMIPWDYNLAFGGFQIRDATEAVNDPIDTPLSVTGSGDHPMAEWILSKPEYLDKYHKYFEDFLEKVDAQKIIDETEDLIYNCVKQDEKNVTSFCTFDEFLTGVDALRTFCKLRTESVRKQLNKDIPSSNDGRIGTEFTPVDASSLDLAVMGSMPLPPIMDEGALPSPPEAGANGLPALPPGMDANSLPSPPEAGANGLPALPPGMDADSLPPPPEFPGNSEPDVASPPVMGIPPAFSNRGMVMPPDDIPAETEGEDF